MRPVPSYFTNDELHSDADADSLAAAFVRRAYGLGDDEHDASMTCYRTGDDVTVEDVVGQLQADLADLIRELRVKAYPLGYLDAQNAVLCPGCADDKCTAFPNWEDPHLHCDDCGERIESAYAEEEAVT